MSFRGPLTGSGGLIRTIVGTDPAAGVEISETVPASRIWRLISVFTVFTADATAISRQPRLLLDDGANTLSLHGLVKSIGASNVANCSWYAAAPGFFLATDTQEGNLPLGNLLAAGFRIRTSTTNFQAGDDYAAPVLLVEEWQT